MDSLLFFLYYVHSLLFNMFQHQYFQITGEVLYFYQMKKLLGLDPVYLELKEVGLIGPCFAYFSTFLLKKYVKTITHISGTTQLSNIIDTLNKNNKTSQQSLKILILLILLIQQKQIQDKLMIQNICKDQINFILNLQRQRYTKIQNKRTDKLRRQDSLDKTISWFKQRFSISKQKNIVPKKIKSTNNSDLRMKTECSISEKSICSNTITSRAELSSDNTQKGQQQLLISKIIIPFCLFLSKIITMQENFNLDQSTLSKQKLWKIINVLKSLIKISQSFTLFLRYYQKDFKQIISCLLQSLNSQIKTYYPYLENFTSQNNKAILKQFTSISNKNNDESIRLQKLKQLSVRMNFNQLKQIVNQFCLIKESLLCFYRGSLTYQLTYQLKIKAPDSVFYKTQSQNLIFQIEKQIQTYELSVKKNKSRSNSQSSRRKQSLVNVSNLKAKLEQQKNRKTISQNSQINPQNNQRKQQKKSNKNPQNNSAFRKLRLNMTRQLDQQSRKSRQKQKNK